MFDELEDEEIDILPDDKFEDEDDKNRLPDIGEVKFVTLNFVMGYH